MEDQIPSTKSADASSFAKGVRKRHKWTWGGQGWRRKMSIIDRSEALHIHHVREEWSYAVVTFTIDLPLFSYILLCAILIAWSYAANVLCHAPKLKGRKGFSHCDLRMESVACPALITEQEVSVGTLRQRLWKRSTL